MELKISDFGLSCVFQPGEVRRSSEICSEVLTVLFDISPKWSSDNFWQIFRNMSEKVFDRNMFEMLNDMNWIWQWWYVSGICSELFVLIVLCYRITFQPFPESIQTILRNPPHVFQPPPPSTLSYIYIYICIHSLIWYSVIWYTIITYGIV